MSDLSAGAARTTPTRRAVVAGAAWSLPVIAAAASTPLASASGCVSQAPLNTVNATYTRVSTGAGRFEWTDVFTSGDRLRLNVAATKIGTGAGSINAANLTLDTAPSGSTYGLVPGATSALRFAVNTGDVWLEIQYYFSFTYAANGTTYAPYSGVSDAAFSVVDIDGQYPSDGSGLGAERVFFNGGSGTVQDSGYLAGNGSTAAWARRANSVPNTFGVDTFTQNHGNVNLTAGGSQWTVTFRSNKVGLGSGQAQYNIWMTPVSFEATNPAPC
ncbi:hypothetical protein [Pseudoclavibacter helvolus]|uniref:hypothetical protein n=1 Tax=Pseudoclavibacter helvolus TaxID=255205 RepID=UPI003C769A8E